MADLSKSFAMSEVRESSRMADDRRQWTEAGERESKNPKYEFRNPKQIQNVKCSKRDSSAALGMTEGMSNDEGRIRRRVGDG